MKAALTSALKILLVVGLAGLGIASLATAAYAL